MRWSLFNTNPWNAALGVEIVKTCWRLIGPTQRSITCVLYRSDAGLELRTYRGGHDLLCALAASTENQAADQAAAWKAAALRYSGFADRSEGAAECQPNPAGEPRRGNTIRGGGGA